MTSEASETDCNKTAKNSAMTTSIWIRTKRNYTKTGTTAQAAPSVLLTDRIFDRITVISLRTGGICATNEEI